MSTIECEFAIFDKNTNINISQYGGEVNLPTGGELHFTYNNATGKNPLYDDYPLSHQGYRANDFSTENGDMYAPCRLRCIYNGKFKFQELNVESGEAIISIFETVFDIHCPDGEKRKLIFILIHGGDTFKGKVGDVFFPGGYIYSEGIQGMKAGTPTSESHIHLDILNASLPAYGTNEDDRIKIIDVILDSENKLVEDEFAKYCGMYPQKGDFGGGNVFGIKPEYSLNFHEVFFSSNAAITLLAAKVLWEGNYFKLSNVLVSDENTPTHGFISMDVDKFFYNGGTMVKGWLQRTNGDWYFLDYSAGLMKKGWVADGAYWYYLDYSTGIMKKGWAVDGSNWYYLDLETGAMQTGLIELNDGFYYLHPTSGAMQTGWQTIDGNTYYFTPSGVAATGYYAVAGVTYHFDENGVLIS